MANVDVTSQTIVITEQIQRVILKGNTVTIKYLNADSFTDHFEDEVTASEVYKTIQRNLSYITKIVYIDRG